MRRRGLGAAWAITAAACVACGSSPASSLVPDATPTQAPPAAGSPPAPGLAVDLQPAFPIRAAFYYPWFAGAWRQHGVFPYTNYHPSLGFYDSGDMAVIRAQIAALRYGQIQAGIASWWGRGSLTDSRIPHLLAAAGGSSFRWAVYYELEGRGDPPVAQIRADLGYIKARYGADPGYLRVGGRFVVFVYADAADRCGMADRWRQANTVGAYLVLKVFPGYPTCRSQPDGWHEYAPAAAESREPGHSFTISPGYWRWGAAPLLARDLARWQAGVRDMVASGAPFQLVTTFNEWGEGTAVESAGEWASPSGFGAYLDVLHALG